MARKGPSTKDYGGFAYDRGKRKRTKVGVGSTVSMRCDDCKHVRYVAPMELRRAAQARCLRCGGHLSMCDSEAKRTRAERAPLERKVGPKCKACGAKFAHVPGLVDHLTSAAASACRFEYRSERYIKERPGAGAYLEGTITLHRASRGSKPWSLQAVAPDGSPLVLFQGYRQFECYEEMARFDPGFSSGDLVQRDD
jgi:hypothetical protein